ncbi:hypothetical protein M0802_007987 [Mischocyttarus mexicanus]|nr:hypothetical protein M0802_007987 [Mischocyttarus mexicanus]
MAQRENDFEIEDEEQNSKSKEFWINTGNFFRLYWRSVFAIIWFIFLTTLLCIYDCQEVRCAYVVLLMSGYWVTEAIPVPITSMIPVALFPIFGIMTTLETVHCYMNDAIMIFMGGLILAFATEHCNLHMRIALIVMNMLGCSHTKLLGGLCTVTTFISMWIANAATTAMMVPIVFAVLYELERQGLGKVFNVIIDPEEPDTDPELKPTSVTKAYFFAAAYASTFGGTGTLVGTPTNLVFKGIFEYTFPEADPITFGDWTMACFPQMALNSFVLWLHLRIVYLGFLRPKSKDAEAARIAEKRPWGPSEGLITWNVIRRKMPWRLVFLLGGGFAISKASNQSCLATRLGRSLLPLQTLHPVPLLAVVLLFVGTLTEVTSNVGTGNIIIPIIAHMEVRCAYVILIMAGYWVLEVFSMAVTALLPIVLFPFLGLLSTAETCTCYMNDTIMVFIGGLILAVAIEHSFLHLRIALGVMRMVGCSHARLLGGLCAVTTFISMWVSNTAATAMMLPIIFAILQELEKAGFGQVFLTEPNPENPNEQILKPSKITVGYLLCIAYSSTFGGTGTLVGTGTNLTFKGIYESTFPSANGINFTNWMLASLPQMIINSFITWIYIRIAYLGYLRPKSKDALAATIGKEGEEIANNVVKTRYTNLGPVSFHEMSVAILFLICIFLWIFRKPGFIRGWSEIITDIEIKDSTPVIFIAILMFFIPKDPTFIHCWNKDPAKRPIKSSDGLITWKVIETKMPWSLIFLLGGGFAISKGSVHSCLAKRVGHVFIPLRHLPPIIVMAFVCSFIGIITEFTSNVGIANITLPVIAQISLAMELHPMYLMIPATLMCSFSFRLPVGTPPNALITVAGHIPTKWLMLGGCIPSLYSLLVEILLFSTWGAYIFDIKQFPAWATDIQTNEDTKCN